MSSPLSIVKIPRKYVCPDRDRHVVSKPRIRGRESKVKERGRIRNFPKLSIPSSTGSKVLPGRSSEPFNRRLTVTVTVTVGGLGLVDHVPSGCVAKINIP